MNSDVARAMSDGAYRQMREAQRKAAMFDAVIVILKKHLWLYGMVMSQESDGTWILMTLNDEGEDMHRFVTIPELITHTLPLLRDAKQVYDEHGHSQGASANG